MRDLIALARACVGAAAAACVLVTAACDRGEDGRHAAPGSAAVSGARTYSVYDLESVWRDQRGAARTLGSLRGRPQVLSLIYTNCTSICPFTVAAIQLVEQQVGDQAGYVLVSLDPERDSPQRLAAYAAEHRLSSRWTLLSGPEGSVRELAALVGVKYRRVAEGEIDHSAVLLVLDANGRMVARFDQPDAVDRAAAEVRRLAPSTTHTP
ncbi:MAG TPA: SCO family protein [Gemmatimonadaceae bacterium]|nr:SCO family protein [Gemmatimonadaceae bacterium]